MPHEVPYGVKRYSTHPLPSYAYLPGEAPHPTRDSGGHSFGRPDPAIDILDADRWREIEVYLYGVDLFNAGYYWEAHEYWEFLWKELPSGETQWLFIQGLIQFAAALLKKKVKNEVGVAKLYPQAREKLNRVRSEVGETYMGINIVEFLNGIESGQPTIVLV